MKVLSVILALVGSATLFVQAAPLPQDGDPSAECWGGGSCGFGQPWKREPEPAPEPEPVPAPVAEPQDGDPSGQCWQGGCGWGKPWKREE